MKKRFWILFSIFSLLLTSGIATAATEPVLPTKSELEAAISAAESTENKTPDNALLLNNLRDTVSLLEQIGQQKSAIDTLQKAIDEADKSIQASQDNLNQLNQNQSIEVRSETWAKMPLADLNRLQSESDQQLQQIQTDLSNLNGLLVAQRSVPERVQTALADNLARTQQLNKLLFSAQVSPSLANKYHAELQLIELKNQYNQLSLNGNSKLTSLYESEVAEKTLEQKQQQEIQAALAEKISQLRLQQSQQQVAELEQSSGGGNDGDNQWLRQEAAINTQISQFLLTQTNNHNQLVQDGLRIRNTLDNLLQTQRNIDEQISALQGTLVLSRIINKQRQALPKDSLISGLAKRITDLRVQIFDINERRDTLYNTADYIANLEQDHKTSFTDAEKAQLTTILQDRRKLLTDVITELNAQLNQSINIDLNQQQVISISNELQNKLEQQSFWVKSNSPIDFDWFARFSAAVQMQLAQIAKLLDFSNWRDYLLPIGSLVGFLLLLAAGITWRKAWIKREISWHNSKVNTLSGDNQWRTLIVLFYTLILALPSTLLFLSSLILIIYFCFHNPLGLLPWALKMAAFWFFIAFTLSLLRPNGIAHRHFDFSSTTNALFRNTLKRSIPILAVLLNASIFTSLENTGIANDVLGETLVIIALLLFLFQIRPGFSSAIESVNQSAVAEQQSERTKYPKLFNLLRLLLLLLPIILITLIGLGYYYTALTLIRHLVASYVVLILWVNLREMTHRAIRVSARQLAYRRLKEKRQQEQNKEENAENVLHGEDLVIDAQDEKIALATVNQQVTKITDIALWLLLIGLFYWVWADLLGVAVYLDNISLWQQTSIDANGATVLESVTLLNFLTSIVILWGTYLVVRNLSGVLEILIFSRVPLSQGSPYAITTILSYLFVALGAGAAFSTLGMSWSKLQWLFAALSVGLGFGLQEIFANFVSGIIILFERPVRIGDLVTIGEFSGTVSKIRIRATTIVDFDGKEVIVPNKAFVTERLTNWSLSNTTTRLVLKIGVAYGSDVELTKKLLLQAAEESPYALKDPAPVVYFLAFGASTLDHELRVYVNKTSERNPTIDFLNRRIDQLFAENKIDIAFNQLDVYIKNLDNGQQLPIKTDNQ